MMLSFKKKREKCKAYRAKLTGEALKRTRRLPNIRVKAFRERAKAFACVDDQPPAAQPSTSTGPFASRQSLGKAVKRVTSALPRSPQKMKFVASKIATIAGLQLGKPVTS